MILKAEISKALKLVYNFKVRKKKNYFNKKDIKSNRSCEILHK